MLFALAWWSILLNRKNTEAFTARADMIQMEMQHTFGISNYEIENNPEYQELESKYKKQQYMILGEGIVFACILIFGVYLINRSFLRELDLSRRQQNFLLSITHELKSPLASIGLVFDTISKRQLEKSKLDSLAQTGKSEKDRLEGLINNLLMAAKIDSNYKYNLEAENIGEVLHAIITSYRNIYPEITIIEEFSSGLMANVDKETFITVLHNLLSNAIKYKSKERQLEILVSAREVDDFVVLDIADNGIGISADEAKHIFDKFYRVGSEYTRTTKGTGLGLYIVKRILRKHGGEASVAVRKPNGTVFTTKWPA